MTKIQPFFKSFFKRYSELPENVPSKEYRFHVVGAYSFLFALLFHLFFIFIFFLISVKPLSLFNIGSTIIWIIILSSHLKGKRTIPLLMAGLEVNLHAAMCVIFIGWGTGFQYYILSTPVVIFFSPRVPHSIKIVLTLAVCLIYIGLHFFFSQATPYYTLEPWLKSVFLYGNILSIFFALSLIPFYYQTAAIKAEASLEQAKLKSEELAALLKKMFGRYLSTEVMNSLIEDPSTLELGGEKRSVTIMMTDLRGFTALSERLNPEQVVQMLNTYFEVMVEVILKYNGTINEIVGDGLLVIFGAPQEMSDRAQRAIACAIEMQNGMSKVNEQNREHGLPQIEMGIGLNETDVVVGNIGSSKRSKYGVVGSGVNMTGRIESYTVGGQILISETVLERAGGILRVDAKQEVTPKGSATPINIYTVGGIGMPYNVALTEKDPALVTLIRQIPVHYIAVGGKHVGKKRLKGFLVRLSTKSAEIEFDESIEILSNLKLNIGDVDNNLSSKDFYGKAIQQSEDNKQTYTIRFTSVPPEVDAYLQAFRQHASKPILS